MKELLYTEEYDVGRPVTFFVHHTHGQFTPEDEEKHVIELSYQFQGQEEAFVFKRIFYSEEAAAFESPYLSWYNLVFCSNNYGPIPIISYMNNAVQQGKKIAATVYPTDSREYLKIIQETEEGYYCFPYNPREYQYMLYVSRKGTLSDYFELEKLLPVYESCGVPLNQKKMEEYFAEELSWFGNLEKCPIDIHNCIGNEELAVVGLLFGYPVESTIALLRKEIQENMQ